MIALVDLEHELARRSRRGGQPGRHPPSVPESYVRYVQASLARISRQRCVVRHYTEVSAKWLEGAPIKALVLGGNVTAWSEYDEESLEPLMQVVRGASLPMLGICGGLQLMALAHGVAVRPMRELSAGERDPAPDIASGYSKEWGFTPVRVMKPDPLFQGLEEPVFLQAHYSEVKGLPENFVLLASTDVCPIQAVRRRGTAVYGTQFHPEAYVSGDRPGGNWLVDLVYPQGYTNDQRDGRRLLVNFFREAGVLSQPGAPSAERSA
mgnify:CR=1 FL=1